jgi:deoxyribonuclease-4
MPLVAHSAYLINLCAVNEETHNKSRLALADELERCTLLGVPGLVLHPGAHMAEGEEKGTEAIARSLDSVFAANPHLSTKVLLENTAGQGTVLGYRFEQIGRILELVDESERLGVCFDSCHAFAAGYDLSDKQGYESVWEAFDKQIGLSRLEAVHLNDSKFPLGLHKDRHATIGAGEIGLEFFAQLIADERFTGVPMVLETPLGDDGEGHRRDLETLRSLNNLTIKLGK